MKINEFYDVSIFIGTVDIFDGGNASKVNCSIEESIYNHIPICKVVFSASSEFIDDRPIVDGTSIVIIIKSEVFNINEKWNFRATRTTAIPNGPDMIYSIEGVVDFYELFRDPTIYSMKNNSSEVFKNIATQNSIEGNIYSTQDNQLWVPSECNLYQWMNYVTQHAWASQQSGYFWCLDRNRALYFMDIDRLVYDTKNIPMFVYGDLTDYDISNNIIRYKNLAIDFNSGDENLFGRGYDGEVTHFDLLSYKNIKEKANKVRAVSEIININKKASQGLKRDSEQFDVGNHHKNFFLAEAQNRRVLSTFSTYVDLACEYFVPIKLAQVCSIKGSAPNSTIDSIKTINIKYIISKISIKINSSTVNMNVELCSQGYNGKSTESY